MLLLVDLHYICLEAPATPDVDMMIDVVPKQDIGFFAPVTKMYQSAFRRVRA